MADLPSRLDLLRPHGPPPKVVSYNFAIVQSDNVLHVLRQNVVPQITLRPRLTMTNVTARDQVFIESLYIDVGTDSEPRDENQIVVGQGLDAYYFSHAHLQELQRAFMRRHHLFSIEHMYAYCEENDLDPPSNPRLDLPTMRKGKPVRVTGRMPNVPAGFTFVLSFVGDALEQPA
jgi:hypothetical protein